MWIAACLQQSAVTIAIVGLPEFHWPSNRAPSGNAANIGERKTWTQIKWILHLAKFRYGATASKSVYIVYQPRRQPNIVQSLVDLRWVSSKSPMGTGNFGERGAHCKVYGLSAVSCANMAEPIDVSFGLWTRMGRRMYKFNRIRQVAPVCPHGKAHRYLANTTEPSICGGDAALCQITLTTY